jgi:hypothetical protein
MKELRETAQLTRDAVLKPLKEEPEVQQPEVTPPPTTEGDKP